MMARYLSLLLLAMLPLGACSDGDVERYKSQFGEHRTDMTRLLVRVGDGVYPTYVGGVGSDAFREFTLANREGVRDASLEWMVSSASFPIRGIYSSVIGGAGDMRVTLVVPFDAMRAEDAVFDLSGVVARDVEARSYFITAINKNDLMRIDEIKAAVIRAINSGDQRGPSISPPEVNRHE